MFYGSPVTITNKRFQELRTGSGSLITQNHFYWVKGHSETFLKKGQKMTWITKKSEACVCDFVLLGIYRIYLTPPPIECLLGKCSIWEEKLMSTAPGVKRSVAWIRCFCEEFRLTQNPLQSKSNTALEIYFHQKWCSSVQNDCTSPLAINVSV